MVVNNEAAERKITQSYPDWQNICAKCRDGEIEPKDCEYYGEPNGCNSPIYGEHPTTEKSSAVGNAAAMRDIPKPDPNWKDVCAKCMEGEIEPKDCEYYAEPNGCNSPIYGEHPKQIPSCSPNCSIKQKVLTLDEAIAHAEECVDESPCGQNHRQLADWLKELKKLKVGGNAAAMREALELMNDLFDKGVICTAYANTAEEMEQIEELYRKAKEALSAPPRNCDVGTPEEQSERWWKFCDRHFICSLVAKDNCAKCPIRGTNRHCELAWAQMPYTEGGEK